MNIVQPHSSMPMVSILIPSYNRARYLSDSVSSALSQNYDNYEVIIVDDGSTDNTAEIVRAFSDCRLRYVRKEHSGAPATRNRCIAEAQGEYLLWLDSDDVLMPGVLLDYVAILTKIPELDVIYGDLQATDEKLNPIRQLTYPDWYGHNQELLVSLFCSNSIPNPATLVKKTCYSHYGDYNLNFPRAHDYEFWSRLAKTAVFKHCDKIVVKWRWHDSNMSTENTNFDTRYDAMVLHGMLQMYSLQELLPTISWNNDSDNEAAATAYLVISQRLHSFKDHDGSIEYAQHAYKLVPDAGILKWLDKIRLTENSDNLLTLKEPRRALPSAEPLRIIAIIAAHNEGDIIYHVIGDLISNGVSVYLIDNQSTDNTVQEASRWLNRGLIHIERFPEDVDADLDYAGEYRWREILLRKEQLAAQLGADWYIHADADEFRESPWEGLTLSEAIRRVDQAGYNAIDFELYNFRPTDNSFIAGADVRTYLTHYEPGEDFNSLQIKAWKNTGVPVDIATHGGHNIAFKKRKIYPHRFILRHYPIRSQLHGIRKVFEERKKRFTREEIEGGWHLQYNTVTSQHHNFLYAKDKLKAYDPSLVRHELFSRPIEVAVFCLECPEQAYSRIRLINIQKHFSDRIRYSFGVRKQSNNDGYLFDLALSRRADIIIISRLFPSSITATIINDFLEFGKPVIYDVDELFTDIPLRNPFKTLADACNPYIEKLMRRANMVTVATERLKEELAPFNANIQVLPNYLDDQIWRNAPKIKKQHDRVTIGYAGWFTNKTDLEHIEEALIKLSHKYGDNITFSFMGCITDRIKSLPNCHYVEGEIDYVEYASALSRSGLDIALAPHLDSRFSQCKSSIKWLEYSACGYAGIFSNVAPYNSCVENMKTGVLVENTAEKWFEAMDMLVSNPVLRQKIGQNAFCKVFSDHTLALNGHRYIQAYRSLLYGNEDAGYLQSTVTRPAASVVIVTYNSKTTLKACIESVARSLSPGDDVVLVDNASRDETVAMAEQLIHRFPAFKIIKNVNNVGFSAATNQGVLATQNPLVVLLNPDTVVPKNWLNGLSSHLGNSVAAVGPVSNYVAGLQKMELYQREPLPSEVQIDNVAELFRQWNDGKAVDSRLLIGFCVMIRRDALKQINYLDSDLFLGNDDLDISWRLRLHGYQLKVATDVFVYHAGQVSFSSESNETTKQLVQESTDHLYRKLLAHYAPAPVPSPMDLWGIGWFNPSPEVIAAAEAGQQQKKIVNAQLVSIIILTFNQLWCTKECVESIQQHTPESHEIIFIDNGSNDGTVDWLREQVAQHDNYRLIENGTNLGFAKGCNQGIEAAQGEYVLLLNNDVVVTTDWLAGLLECYQRKAKVGIVGPMTNNISGIQRVADVGYSDAAGMHAFAQSFRERNRYRMIENRRIVGFCMLFRKQLADEIGLLDETFGSGNFEDDDYCLRAELAGYCNYIAGDVFIHHYGSQTFAGNKMDYGQAMQNNMALYQNKWDYKQLDEATLRRLIPLDAAVESRRLVQQGETDKAIDLLLHKGIKVEPGASGPYLELVELLLGAGRHEDALQVLPEMPVSVDPALKQELTSVCHCALGDDQTARQAAQQAGGRPRALVVLGTLAARQGDLAEAERLLRQAIQIDPSLAKGWLSLGMLLWGQGQQEPAWQAVQRAATVDTLDAEALTILRDMAERLNRQTDVCLLLDQAVPLYPQSRQLAIQHAQMLSRTGQYDEALVACERFLVQFGADDSLLVLALELRERIGAYDRVQQAGSQSVSLCMIVKNEEAWLARCLASAKPVVHELIVVDTGSTDRTESIAKAFGAKLYNFPWNGNFSDARNHALEQAMGAWVLVLDADEVISNQDYKKIQQAISSAAGQSVAWSVLTRNYTPKVHAQGWTANDGSYPAEERVGGWHPSIKVRLFPATAEIRFAGEIHEMVEPALKAQAVEVKQADFVVHHYGELKDESGALQKKQRYYALGKEKLIRNPNNVTALIELGVQAGELGLYQEAIDYWDRVLVIDPVCVEALFNKGYALIGLQKYQEALAVTEKVLELAPAHKESAFNYGTCMLYVGNPTQSLKKLEPILRQHPQYPPLLAVLTLLYLLAGEREKAATCYVHLTALNYAIADYAKARADILVSLDKKDQARTLLEECSAIGMNI